MADRIIVCGSRWWDDDLMIERALLGLLAVDDDQPFEVVQGGQISQRRDGSKYGADYLAKVVAEDLGLRVREVRADWKKLGKRAGPIRNQKMLDKAKPFRVLAFSDFITTPGPDGKTSNGTYDMITRAAGAGVPVDVFSHWEAPSKGRSSAGKVRIVRANK